MARLTPTPRLFSLVPELLGSGPHPFKEATASLLGDPRIESVDLVSFCVDCPTLRDLEVLRPRRRTRVLLVPPGGASYADAAALSSVSCPGLEIREVDRTRVPEVVHLKLLTMKAADGRSFVITGSSNYTVPGTGASLDSNAECSVLFETSGDPLSAIQSQFERLWDGGSRPVDPSGYLTKSAEEGKAGTSITLMEFQESVLRELKGRYQSSQGQGGMLLSLPTGSGKTTIAVKFLLDSVLTDPSKKVLWLAPHVELHFQAASTFEAMKGYSRCPSMTVPTEAEVANNAGQHGAQVEFRTTSSVYNWYPHTKNPAVVVVDEAHYGASLSRKMLPAIQKDYGRSFLLGLTGTPFRKSASELGDLKTIFKQQHNIDRETIGRTRDALGRPILAAVDAMSVKTGFSIRLDDNALEAQELDRQSLRSFNKPERNRAIARTWRAKYGPTLAFAVDIDHANALARSLHDVHQNARIQVVHSGSVSSNVPSIVRPAKGEPLSRDERRRVHELVRQGRLDIVVAVNMYVMGVDFPATRTLLMARPTLSPVLYSQMLGRGLRGPAFGGTDRVRVIDYADQIDTHDFLKKRLMSYQFERRSEAAVNHEMTLARSLWRKARLLTCSMAIDELRGRPGVYRVVTKSGTAVDRRGWKWVGDIGRTVVLGQRNKSLHDGHRIQYISSAMKNGKETASRLRMAEDLGFLDREDE